MVKRPKKFVTVDDSTVAVARVKCSEGWAGPHIRELDVI